MQTPILPTKSTESVQKGGKTSLPKDHPNHHKSKHLSQTAEQTLDFFGTRAERRAKISPHRSCFTNVTPQLDTLAKLHGSNKTFPNPSDSDGAIGVNQREGAVSKSVEYPHRAMVLYSFVTYMDSDKISFQKHEILEVSDVSGTWCSAKKSNGETGLVPCNSVILL